MQSPVVSRQVITTPGGRRSVLGHTRSASLSDPANPLSLRSLVETSTVNGRVSSSTFDALSRRLTEEAPSGHRVIADVDAHGRTTRVEAPGVTPKTYEYDARGRLHRSAQGARETVYAYGADGRIASLTDPLNRTTAFTYDAAGRTTALKRPDARQVGYSYDSSGNLRSLTPPGRAAHTFAYSSRDLLTSYTPPQLGAAAAPTSYTQDGDELVTAMNRADGSTVGFRYDDASQLDRLTQPRGTTDFVYSAQTGTMTSATGPGSEKIAYTYDGSLPTRATVTGTFSGQVTNTYDDDFRLATQSIGGSDSAAYVYDDDGRLIRGGGLTLARDAVTGLVSGLSLGASTTAITRNAFGEPESTATKQGASAVYGESYGRDASGRITSKAESRLASSANVAYTYDSSDRLYQVRRDGTLTATYGYDDNGNRTSVIRAGDALPTTADYDAQDRMTRYGANTYSYSDAGALRTKVAPEGTTSYEYDALGSLTKATLPAGTTLDYVVDPTGRRIGGQARRGARARLPL